MATASPTPMTHGLVRRTSQRQALRRPTSRSMTARSEPPHAPAMDQSQKYNNNKNNDDESSEDEIPVPMKLSALTKALLNDGAPEGGERPPSPPRTRTRSSQLNASTSSASGERRQLRSSTQEPRDDRPSKQPSPFRGHSQEPSPARKRVVRLSHTPQGLNGPATRTRRSTSGTRASTQRSRPGSWHESKDKVLDVSHQHQDSAPEEDHQESKKEVNTPAQGRIVRIVSGSSGRRSRMDSSGPPSGRYQSDRSVPDKSAPEAEEDHVEAPDTAARNAPVVGTGSISRYPSTATRGRLEDLPNPQSSMRVKRMGKLPGSFLSGPARRGRRRQSEEDGEENGDGENLAPGQEPGPQAGEEPHMAYYGDGLKDFNSGSPVSGGAAARAGRKHASSIDLRNVDRLAEPAQLRDSPPEIWVPKVEIRPKHDQENEIPSTYKRSKPSVDQILEKIPQKPVVTELSRPQAASPERKPLAPITNNTPHRPAPPPPPKMSVLDAATNPAGAATTTQGKARRNVLKVNGKCYTRLDCLGRGGSAKVYRVTAENGKMFALKRVALENTDEVTIRGYKGEIDLLGKLSGVERVINLFDYEMNEEKQVLTLLMEMGELDLHTLMRSRQNPEAAKFDPVFVRFYWKEMIECVQAVHQCDIVHSDLKPANFVLVQGRLKLIDFGIANAIQTDETVNVHRETQVGTPNYMSPESLLDANNPRGGRLPGRPKLTKLGKPSDVWSLGCILYQMVYGTPPFGHIVNPMARCQAIINWDHQIEYPARAVGDVHVPPSVIRTLKRCLNRDQHMRPTCEELLHRTDPFLYPAELSEKALPIDEELLGRIIHSVVTRCRERMPTEAESHNVWPQAYWTSVKKAMAGRM